MLERAAVHATDVGAPVDALAHYAQLMSLDPPDDIMLRASVGAAAYSHVAPARACSR